MLNCPRSRGRIDVRIKLRLGVPRYADSCGSDNWTLGFLVRNDIPVPINIIHVPRAILEHDQNDKATGYDGPSVG